MAQMLNLLGGLPTQFFKTIGYENMENSEDTKKKVMGILTFPDFEAGSFLSKKSCFNSPFVPICITIIDIL